MAIPVFKDLRRLQMSNFTWQMADMINQVSKHLPIDLVNSWIIVAAYSQH